MPDEWKVQEVDLSNDITTILAVPALVLGVYVNETLSAHACPIKSASTQNHVIPSGATAGNSYNFGPSRYEDSLIVDPDNAATGKIAVMYVDLARDN